MRLAFIYPPYRGIRDQPSIKAVSDNYGIYPPINLAYVAGVARHKGHTICIIDANAEHLSNKEVLSRLRQFKPDAILFTITTYLFHQTLRWIRFLKLHFTVSVIVGGVHVSYYPKETIMHPEIDIGVIGDGECTLPALLSAMEKGLPLSGVSHICFKENGKTIVTGTGDHQEFIKGVYPARDMLLNNKYYEFISQKKNFTGIISSKGCPFHCRFCEQGRHSHYSNREVPDVINEISDCYYKYKIREIDFFDPIFSVDQKRAAQICDGIRNLGLDIDFAVRTRVDCVSEELLSKLQKAGCKRIYYGIESASPKVLFTLNKRTTIPLIEKQVKKTKQHGIDTFGYFMFGNPGDTLKTIRDTAKFSRRIKLDFAQYNQYIPMAGTETYEKLVRETGDDFWSRYTMENEEPDWRIPHSYTSLPAKTIEREIESAFRAFYFRPEYIFKRICKIRSFNEFARYGKAAIGFIK